MSIAIPKMQSRFPYKNILLYNTVYCIYNHDPTTILDKTIGKKVKIKQSWAKTGHFDTSFYLILTAIA